MTKADSQLTHNDVAIEDRECVYQGFFRMERLTLRHRLFNGQWSAKLSRELFVRPRAVAAILYDPKHLLVGLVEQFRIGLVDAHQGDGTPWCLEVVAGMTEPGETSKQVILRELYEEAGIVPTQLVFICDYYSSPGGTNERLDLYCALADLSQAEGIFGLASEGEDIRVITLPEDEVFSTLYNGRYNNAATLICLQWLERHRIDLSRKV